MPSSTYTEPVPWPPHSTPVDLTSAAVSFADSRGLETAATVGRYQRVICQVEQAPICIRDVPPVQPVGFLDGVQAEALLGRTAQRDIRLAWVAAGTVHRETLLDHQPRLAIVCSELDEDQVRSRAPQVPIVTLPDTTPWGVALSATEWVDQARRHVEGLAIASAPTAPDQVVVVDGPLPRSTDRDDLVGVVKEATGTQWLSDPALLPADEAWRSPAFRIPRQEVSQRSILSAFVRLHTATEHHPYGHALVRVEVYEDSPVGIDAAAAMAYAHRGRKSSGDARWAIQMHQMFITERVLKAQIPHVIRTLR